MFCREYDKDAIAYTIEDDEVLKAVNNADMIVFSYPVQFSTVPKIMRDFVTDNKELWRNKKVFVINKCPREAITLLGKCIVEQCGIEKYL